VRKDSLSDKDKVFLEQLSPHVNKLSRNSDSTALNYQTAFLWLCRQTDRTPDQPVSDLKRGRTDVYNLLDSYVGFLVDDLKLAPSTTIVYLSGVKRILRFSDVEINNDKLRLKLVLPKTRAITNNRIPTVEELRLMLSLTDLRGKTVLTMLVSSGMRIGELLQLKVGDVDFTKPTRLDIRASNTKTKRDRVVFISDEACLAGALTDSEYKLLLAAAGFENVEIDHVSNSNIGEFSFAYFSSHIRAIKPHGSSQSPLPFSQSHS
jgi:integrase